MKLITSDGTEWMTPGAGLCGKAAYTARFNRTDFRQLLLLGEGTLAKWLSESLMVRMAFGQEHPTGMVAWIDGIEYALVSGYGLPDGTEELEIGLFAMQWLVEQELRSGPGTIAEIIRSEFIPKMAKH